MTMFTADSIAPTLPPGLTDSSVEFFADREGMNCLTNGQRHTWDTIPSRIIEMVENNLLDNPEAIAGLIQMGHETRDGKLQQYAFCRFGGFDGNPDITPAGEILHTEYVECGNRGSCRFEGVVCASIRVGNDFLTKQEINVLKKVASGKPNKAIAAELFISEETVSSHNQNIQRKLSVSCKVEMAIWAVKRNIVEP